MYKARENQPRNNHWEPQPSPVDEPTTHCDLGYVKTEDLIIELLARCDTGIVALYRQRKGDEESKKDDVNIQMTQKPGSKLSLTTLTKSLHLSAEEGDEKLDITLMGLRHDYNPPH